ncbi:MAG: hypothetical protein LQ345_006743 [Seirophora villosa]|nr:MAG: hypothetical protein LQ345_006743 [Seirophora villosa]
MSSIITSVLSTLKGAAVIALCAVVGVRLVSSLQRRPGAVAITVPPPSTLPAPTPSSPIPSCPPQCTTPFPITTTTSTASMILADFRRSHLRKKAKSVRFDLMRNTLHTYTPTACKFAGVRWAKNKSWVVFEHEADPAGYDTLHCQKTLYVRDAPDIGALDDDGDVDME